MKRVYLWADVTEEARHVIWPRRASTVTQKRYWDGRSVTLGPPVQVSEAMVLRCSVTCERAGDCEMSDC
jgi:hypothetical protein